MGFLRSLIACDDRAADSLTFGGGLCILALVFFTGWDEIAAGHPFSPMGFAGAAAAIIAAVAGGKRARDGISQGQP